ADEKYFCCEGCKQVYLLLNEKNLCTYYALEKNPGIKATGKFKDASFGYLDDLEIAAQLLQYQSETQCNVSFSIPQLHCPSCVYLLEQLPRIHEGIIKSTVDFQRKEVFIMFNPEKISLREVVELLSFIGYQPYISLNDAGKKKIIPFNKKRIYQIGVAGFCFANIMMLSFPEYFSSGHIEQQGLRTAFTGLIFFLSLLSLIYCGRTFFTSAWDGIKQRNLNIDTPIALAILVTFSRSYYEIFSGIGNGYLDSGTGIIFLMLVGRWFQDKTYAYLSFDRDYKSYFPLGATIISGSVEQNIPVSKLKKGQRIIVRNMEMIPADAVLIKGEAAIDYSFISGESDCCTRNPGDVIYAGGKQSGQPIELEIIHEVAQGYLTKLWNNDTFISKNKKQSFIHPWSRYFTVALFSIAFLTAVFWWINNPAKILPSITAVLIVACPCSLLLSSTFTFGSMLRIFGKNKLYLKNAPVIESLAAVNCIVFDKTGTLTVPGSGSIYYQGPGLSDPELIAVKETVLQSTHPFSKMIAAWLNIKNDSATVTKDVKEVSGSGVQANVNNVPVRIGSAKFAGPSVATVNQISGSKVYINISNTDKGFFVLGNRYRTDMQDLVAGLKKQAYELHVLSGDNENERKNLQQLFGQSIQLRFNQSPQDKLDYIKDLQQQQKKVLMIGDGLNDAGALMQSEVGIAVSDHSGIFTPACDGILEGSHLGKLNRLLSFARSGKKIVAVSFALSLIYNIVGLSFAVTGTLSPMIAAILMPISSVSIITLSTLTTGIIAAKKKL
ncbi:MAG: heavy metal translocating P-type ATPase metal-binding domain-containing protein, partial [Ferruginibacter sp.]